MTSLVNGHSFERDTSRLGRRQRDVKVLRCSTCGKVARVSMRSLRPPEELLRTLNLEPCDKPTV
jgi:hypothetical protein